MKQYFIALLGLCISLSTDAREKREIIKLEIYGRYFLFNYGYKIPAPKNELKKKSAIYAKVLDEGIIRSSKIQEYIDNLVEAKEQGNNDIDDYRALLIVHYSNKRKEKYYIGKGWTYRNNVRYVRQCEFVAAIYSFLPIYFYGHDGHYYQKPCEEVEDISLHMKQKR